MPFVSDSQRKKCYLIQRQMNQQGMVSNWDCKEFEKASPKAKKSPKKVNDEKIFKGVRGGKYVIRNNKKVYISNVRRIDKF